MTTKDLEDRIFDPDSDQDEDLLVSEYDIVAAPNDFNVLSYFTFIEAGAIEIPDFQRHYIWDQRRASKLIESILIGLPIPQLFLYEKSKNNFLVIDGQQRLMTIYYFMKGRFPKRDARGVIRKLLAQKRKLDAADFDNDDLFVKFKLSFKQQGAVSPFSGATYESLGENKPTFELRTIRNIMVKQVRPEDNNSSMFELFNRLNTGGMNLSAQEIRMSLYHSDFLKHLVEANENESWRAVLDSKPDPRQKDVEIILRMLALALGHQNFSKPLSKFLNDFCRMMRSRNDDGTSLTPIFFRFSEILSAVDRSLLLDEKTKRLSVPMLEALFAAACTDALQTSEVDAVSRFGDEEVREIRDHADFIEFFTGKTTDVPAVRGRIRVAKEVLQ